MTGTHPIDQPEERIKTLDAFRALAIIPVVLYHYFTRWEPPQNPDNVYGYDASYAGLFDWGGYGVEFFFIISGFVIFMTLLRCRHVFEFWYRRFARLWPALVTCAVGTFAVTALIGPEIFRSRLSDLAWSTVLLARYAPGAQWVDGAYWSLLVELKFYFWIGLVFLAGAARFTRAWGVFVAIGLIVWAAAVATGGTTITLVAREVFLVDYLPFFTAGVFFFKLWSSKKPDWGLAGLATFGYLAVWSGVVPYRSISLRQGDFESAVRSTVDFRIHGVVLLMVIAFWLFSRGRLTWLANPPLLFFGRISYTLYLLHQFIGVSIIRVLRSIGVNDLLAAAFAFTLVAAAAFVVTSLIEVPGKRALMSFGRRGLFPRWPARTRLAYES